MPCVNPDDLVRFVRRDWRALDRAKRDFWVERYRREGSGPARAAATALLAHVRALNAEFPSALQRAADLECHLRLRDQLDRAARAFTRR